MNTTETIRIEGMSCDHCVRAVRRALEEMPGVDVRNVSIGAAEISYDPEKADREAVAATIEEEGFHVVGNE